MDTPAYAEDVTQRILLVRGRRVILDSDLAWLYGVATKALNQAVKRNAERFPPDFLFRLTAKERDALASACQHLRRLRFSPSLPFAYTEHGAVMAANVVRAPRAVRASIYVVRAFNHLREALASHRELAWKLAELERRLSRHDHAIRGLVAAMKGLLETTPQRRRLRIGFRGSEAPRGG